MVRCSRNEVFQETLSGHYILKAQGIPVVKPLSQDLEFLDTEILVVSKLTFPNLSFRKFQVGRYFALRCCFFSEGTSFLGFSRSAFLGLMVLRDR